MGLNNDDIKQLIAILQKGLSNDDAKDEEIEEVIEVKKPKPKTSTKTPKKKYINKFEKMPEFKMCKEDVEIDKKIRKPQPSERKAPFQYVKVRCRVCGKQEKVAPELVESNDRYKCNKCSTGAG